MSGSHSSSGDESSGGNSSDEGSGDDSGSESGSSSSSGSGDESSSRSDSVSGSSTGSESGSGSSSGEDDDNGSSSSGSGSEDSGDGAEEEEDDEGKEQGDTEERRLARKREDFEKMKEISLHMDNIVQRLSTFFPRDDKETGKDCRPPHPPVPPELPALPLPPPDKAVDRSASARVMTMDRAVSARRLTTDRAVSVASGLHFDDDLSASTVSNTRYEEQQNAGSRRAAGNGQGNAGGRRQSATDAGWAGRDRTGPERRVGTRGQHQADEIRAAQGRRESWQGGQRNTNSAGMDLRQKKEPGGGGRRSRASLGSPATELEVEGFHERLLWDDLRESLEGAAGAERVRARSTWARGVVVEKTKEERDREQRRRRLIDEAIAVLLEGSTSSSGGSSNNSSSDGERLNDSAL